MRMERCKNYDQKFTGIEIFCTLNSLAGAIAERMINFLTLQAFSL
jgi:hypothetical protein